MDTGMLLNSLLLNSEGKVDSLEMRKNSGLSRKMLNVNGTLSHEAYIKWDEKVVDIARKQLTVVADLAKYNLVDSSLNLGDIVSNYEQISDMTAANVDMDGATPGQRDRLTFTEQGVPVPIFHKSFQLNQRQIQATLDRPGRQLPSLGISTASRLVADQINAMCWDGFGRVVDGKQVYGFTNHPNRNTKTISNPWGGGSETPVADVQDMIAKLQVDNYGYGENTCVLYVSPDNWSFIDNDYSTQKGEKTYKQRFEAFAPIAEVRLGTGLADGELVLVEMRDDVVELKVGQDLTWFEQPQSDMMQHDFKVLAAMALVVKTDANNNCGVVHATGA
jgi:hypothetical protein